MNVLIDQPADGVTRLTLNRPDRLNALRASSSTRCMLRWTRSTPITIAAS